MDALLVIIGVLLGAGISALIGRLLISPRHRRRLEQIQRRRREP